MAQSNRDLVFHSGAKAYSGALGQASASTAIDLVRPLDCASQKFSLLRCFRGRYCHVRWKHSWFVRCPEIAISDSSTGRALKTHAKSASGTGTTHHLLGQSVPRQRANAEVRAREYLADAEITRLLHQAGAAPLRTSGTIDLPRHARNEYKSVECPAIVVLSRPYHRPRVSALRGLVPRRRTMIFAGNSSLPPV